MLSGEQELRLGESYDFDVVVDRRGRRFSGKLLLSSERCTLRISGETSERRPSPFGWENVDALSCRSVRGSYFLLVGLKIVNASNGVLERYPSLIGAFEINYEIEYVISARYPLNLLSLYDGFELSSPLIDSWVGMTTTQRRIIAEFSRQSLFSGEANLDLECETSINGIGVAFLRYSISVHDSIEDFSSGVRFPPKVVMQFFDSLAALEVIELLNKICTFFSVVLGQDLLLDKIRLLSRQSFGFDIPSLYFSARTPKRTRERCAVFPLGRNLLHDEFHYPEFPLESLNCYFHAPEAVLLLFEKYVRYRRLENPEERFLGYFRLLERIAYQQACFVDEKKLENMLSRANRFLVRYFEDKASVTALLKQIKRANRSKLNTAGCIIKFLDEIPRKVSDTWIFKKGEIDSICKLRNDLSHANEVVSNKNDVEIRAKFVEILLLFGLFRSVGIPFDTFAELVQRVDGYEWIVKRVNIQT